MCAGNNPLDLKGIFQGMSHELEGKDRNFMEFMLINRNITELPANVFSDIHFDQIVIEGASSLQHIHRLAFNGTEKQLKNLVIYSTPLADSHDPEYSVFKAINPLKALNYVVMADTKLTAIPDMAFDGHPWLYQIEMSRFYLKTIGAQAFHNLTRVEDIRLPYNEISRVSDTAFAVTDDYSDRTLHLHLSYNMLGSGEALTPRVLAAIKRPVHLYIDNDGYKYLNRKVFEGFVKQNPKNIIYSDTDCMDSRNDWLRNEYSKQWEDENCA